jgi:hypothetical protein
MVIFEAPWGKVLLTVHLLVAAFALGSVTHHFWLLNSREIARPKLRRYAHWMTFSYALSWFIGAFLYPSYNATARHVPGGLQEANPWAVGLFEYKEHFGTFALLMLPWLLIAATRFDALKRFERISYGLGTWFFTLAVYVVFIAGAVVTMTRGIN